MKILHTLAFAAVLSFSAAPLLAQTPGAAPATTPAAGQKAPKKQVQRTAKSLECSKQATAQKLHGKPRKVFMNKCKKA